MSGNPVKNQGKKPRRNLPCNEIRKRRYITRRNIFLPGLNQRVRHRTVAGVTTRVVFLYQVLLGIANYTEQDIAIRSRLYRVEHFHYSEQVMQSRIFFLFRVDYTEQNIFTLPSRLYRVEHFYYSEQVMPSRIFLLFRVGYTEQNISAIPSR